ncbi:MAG: cytochrome P450 [Pseudomonadota bacterium]
MRDLAASPTYPVRVKLGTEPLGIWGSWRTARRNVLEIIPDAATRLPIISGSTVRRWHMVMDPDALRRVLLEHVDNYPKSIVTKNLLEPAIGDSLFIAEGAHWRWQRRTAAPVFSHRNVAALGPVMTSAAERSAARIAQAGPRKAVNVLDDMVTTTFEVIADVTFSGDGSFDRNAVHDAINAYIDAAGRISIFDVIGLPGWVPRPNRVVAVRSMQDMQAEADRAIERRAAAGSVGIPDLLDLLLQGEDSETARKMTVSELRDNLLTFIVAGHETTALALSWSLYLCGFDTEVQDRARAEAVSVLGGRAATADDVVHLPFVRQIIDEALRLYPPGGFVSRTAQSSDRLAGQDIKPGDTVMLPIYAVHRHHALWDDPDAFDPNRFADRKSIDRYAYLPFGDGPRICIGASFALQEAVIILATLLARFRFTAVPGRVPDPIMILTLRPEGGVWMMAEPI